MVAENGEPTGVFDDAVELVAMHDEEAPPIGGLMDRLFEDRDAAELHVGIVAQRLVMVAGHIDHLGALARLAQQLLHHIVVALSPIPAAPEAPAVDDIADEIEIIGLGMLQEIEEEFGLAALGAEMDVADPDRTIAIGRCDRVHECAGYREARSCYINIR